MSGQHNGGQVSGRHHRGCPDCDHPKHVGECGAPITETHRDMWSLAGKPTGKTTVLIVDTCPCGISGLDEFHPATTRWTKEQ